MDRHRQEKISRRKFAGNSANGILGMLCAGSKLQGAYTSKWVKSPANPMLSLGSDGDSDSQNIMSPSIAREGGRYFLFYAGGPSGPANGGGFVRYQIGLALSQDGKHWHKHGKPLMPLGERDNFHVTPALLRSPDGSLLKERGLWQMAFCGNRADDVYHATSPDGIHWKKHAESPIYRHAYAPNLVKVGHELRMYYVRKPGIDKRLPEPWEIHLATGRDLLTLRPYRDNPMLTLSQPWEQKALFYPYVLKQGGRWVMFYAAYWKRRFQTRINYTAIGCATSPDGIRWTKYSGNPVLTPTPGSPYDSVYTSSQSVLHDGRQWKMYYASRIDAVHKYYAICLATKQGNLVK